MSPSAQEDIVVARIKLEDFGSPERDGLPLHSIAPHSTQKIHYLWKYADTAALAMASPRAFPGARAYVDLYASCGVCETKGTLKLSFGSALLAPQVTKPFDLYYLNDLDEEMTAALSVRVKRLGIQGQASSTSTPVRMTLLLGLGRSPPW